jgi:hypothetical protein
MLYSLHSKNSTYLLVHFPIFFNFRNICVSVAAFRNTGILQNILQYIPKDRDIYIFYENLKGFWDRVVLLVPEQFFEYILFWKI